MRIVPPSGGLMRPDADLADLTNAERTGPLSWDEDGVTLVIPFDTEPTPSEQAAIRRRLLTRDAAHEAQVKAMQDALSDPTVPEWGRVVLTALLGDLA